MSSDSNHSSGDGPAGVPLVVVITSGVVAVAIAFFGGLFVGGAGGQAAQATQAVPPATTSAAPADDAEKEREELRGRIAELEAQLAAAQVEEQTTEATESTENVAAEREAWEFERGKLIRQTEELRGQLASAAKQNESRVASPDPPRIQPFAQLEERLASFRNWERLNGFADDDHRIYGHTSGVRVEFLPDEAGYERMVWKYRPGDKLERTAAMGVWLLIISIGGEEEEVYRRNSDRIAAWEENRTHILLLEGGFIAADVEADQMVLSAYTPSTGP